MGQQFIFCPCKKRVTRAPNLSTFLIEVTQKLSSLYFFFFLTRRLERLWKGSIFLKFLFMQHIAATTVFIFLSYIYWVWWWTVNIRHTCTFVNMYSDLYVKMKAALIKMVSSMEWHSFIDFLILLGITQSLFKLLDVYNFAAQTFVLPPTIMFWFRYKLCIWVHHCRIYSFLFNPLRVQWVHIQASIKWEIV